MKSNWYKFAKNQGDCFISAGRYISTNGIKNPNLVLVHAKIRPRMGPMKNVVYWHAWVEDGDKIIDLSNGKDIDSGQFEKNFYYLIADPQLVKKYTFKEVLEITTKVGNWGPWD